jgi:hypothetical protein
MADNWLTCDADGNCMLTDELAFLGMDGNRIKKVFSKKDKAPKATEEIQATPILTDDLARKWKKVTSDDAYCGRVVSHLGLSGQEASEIKLTVENSGEKSMKVIIESNNEDAVDFLLIPGDVTGSPSQSAVDSSVAGKMSIKLTWEATAPTVVALNVLWSKVST